MYCLHLSVLFNIDSCYKMYIIYYILYILTYLLLVSEIGFISYLIGINFCARQTCLVSNMDR